MNAMPSPASRIKRRFRHERLPGPRDPLGRQHAVGYPGRARVSIVLLTPSFAVVMSITARPYGGALKFTGPSTYILDMRVLCVARHPFLSEHLGRFFEQLGVETVPCVGLAEATEIAPAKAIDAVICDYDLLAALSSDVWETHALLTADPVIAVSLTRHPGDAHLRDATGVAGFFYLPTLEADAARAMLAAIGGRGSINPPDVLPWLGTTSIRPQL